MREVQSENMYTVLWERYIWFSSNSSIIKSKITLTFNFDQMHYIYKESVVLSLVEKILPLIYYLLLPSSLFFHSSSIIIYHLLLLIQYLISAEEEEEEEKKKKN